MKLHENKKLFIEAIRTTAEEKGILDIYVEKDYWVTYALRTIFSDAIGKETVFKGGTALSKCFGLIDRFSEDIDLVVQRKEGESNNQLINKIREITTVVSSVLPEIKIDGVTNKKGMNRKTAHHYDKVFTGDFGQVRNVIIVEATWLGFSEPFIESQINSLIYDMMSDKEQKSIAEEYDLFPFKINVLDPGRTICEKIMSLVRFSYTENPLENLKNKVRHIYDLHQLLKNKELREFFESEKFDVMIRKVADDDVKSYRNRNAWLQNHPREAIIFDHPEIIWEELKPTYSNDLSNLVFGDLPDEDVILHTLLSIKDRLEPIDWTASIINPK